MTQTARRRSTVLSDQEHMRPKAPQNAMAMKTSRSTQNCVPEAKHSKEERDAAHLRTSGDSEKRSGEKGGTGGNDQISERCSHRRRRAIHVEEEEGRSGVLSLVAMGPRLTLPSAPAARSQCKGQNPKGSLLRNAAILSIFLSHPPSPLVSAAPPLAYISPRPPHRTARASTSHDDIFTSASVFEENPPAPPHDTDGYTGAATPYRLDDGAVLAEHNAVRQQPLNGYSNGHRSPERPPLLPSAIFRSSNHTLPPPPQNAPPPANTTIPERQRLLATIRSSWKRRHARSVEEGIRRDITPPPPTRSDKLSSILQEIQSAPPPPASAAAAASPGRRRGRRRIGARTLAGLISALAQESLGLEVEVDAREGSPLWGKQVDELRVQFERVGFQPLKMRGFESSKVDNYKGAPKAAGQGQPQPRNDFDNFSIATFDSIDVDNSGALDKEELARALSIASGVLPPPNATSPSLSRSIDVSIEGLSRLASRLLALYDSNGDGVVDREEYSALVKDMAALRDVQRLRTNERKRRRQVLMRRWKRNLLLQTRPARWGKAVGEAMALKLKGGRGAAEGTGRLQGVHDFSNNASLLESMASKCRGSLVLKDLKLDLRRLLVGGIPIIKRIAPGGPLVLEPFTATLTCSFNKQDMMESGLLLEGLSRLVKRALRRRVRSIRDFADGAVFFGTTWNMASAQAPVVEVPELNSIEFDNKDRAIITGRARIRTAPDQPFIENSFKLRTKLGTRDDGQVIGLKEPELALVLECPRGLERAIVSSCKRLNLPIPTRPKPIYKYIPLVSPIKKTEQDGFNLGEDNKLTSIYIKDGALRVEFSAILRPGRFLGNHYLAFTVPNRTFIITTDRVRNGIKEARRNKQIADMASQQGKIMKKKMTKDLYKTASAQAISSSTIGTYVGDSVNWFDFLQEMDVTDEDHSFLEPEESGVGELPVDDIPESVVAKKPGFFGRFLEGYFEAAREETESDRLTTAISEFFGSSDSLDGEVDIDNFDETDELDSPNKLLSQ